MITVDFRGRAALVTGGTRGLGKAIALELSRAGAKVYVTHRWGSVDEAELAAEFVAAGYAAPIVVESDASDPEATRALMERIKTDGSDLHAIVSNVSFAKVVNDLSDLRKNSLDLTLSYSAWPVVDMVQTARDVLGRFPKYVLAISGDGSEVCYDGYDLVGVSKAVLETLCRYLALRLKVHGVRVNVIRSGHVDTASIRATFGEAAITLVHKQVGEVFIDPRKIGEACVALCSGLLDAITGQLIVVDEGWSLVSPPTYLTGRRERFEFPDDPADGGAR
jgi:NAD(P)-dependent dehydrogenase (short-subunit alcohol dehydrogenase family)